MQVRFSDTDAVGHISSGSYVSFMEVGRTDFFYKLAQEDSVLTTVVVNINLDVVSETLFGEEVVVTTWCSKIGSKSMTLSNIIHANGRLVSRGSVTVVGFDKSTRQSVLLPSHWQVSDYKG